MEKKRVAFLGPSASYSHQAALENFPPSSHELVPQVTIADVFHAVQSGFAWRGIVPLENSTNGAVVMTLDLFADRKKQLQDVLVCGEAYVDVRHCLVARLPQELRTARSHLSAEEEHNRFNQVKSRIKKLYSHPQAWGQCEAFLSAHLKGVERQDVSSTSRAAEMVAQEAPLSCAAISSETAAKVFGVDILASGIQDETGNMTRFFILRRGEDESPPSSPILTSHTNDSDPVLTSSAIPSDYASGNPFSSPTFKTLVSFTVPHTAPGALAKSLAVFGEYGLNLTSINTRPSLIEPWNYLFFVEILGKKEGHGRGNVNSALRNLTGVARSWRWLGSWEMQVDTAE